MPAIRLLDLIDLVALSPTKQFFNRLLAALLIESLDSEVDSDAEQAWSAEIQRRLNDIDEGRVKMIPADEARRIIRGQNGAAAD